jgi:hypothetical protein
MTAMNADAASGRAELLGVAAEHVGAVWPLVERHVERALAYGDGEYLAEDIRRFLEAREMQLWVAGTGRGVIGAGVTQLVAYPRRKYCDMILWAADTPLHEWLSCLDVVERWAETHGARPRLFGRRGWGKRLAAYAPKYTVFVRAP